MADKKVDATTGEIQEQEVTYGGPIRTAIEMYNGTAPALLKVHCKPVFNYQSVEFDWAIPYECTEEDLAGLEQIYSKMLAMLVRASAVAPQAETKKSSAPTEELASEKQKEILRNFHIDFKEPLTKKQAHALIKKSMDQEIF